MHIRIIRAYTNICACIHSVRIYVYDSMIGHYTYIYISPDFICVHILSGRIADEAQSCKSVTTRSEALKAQSKVQQTNFITFKGHNKTQA